MPLAYTLASLRRAQEQAANDESMIRELLFDALDDCNPLFDTPDDTPDDSDDELYN